MMNFFELNREDLAAWCVSQGEREFHAQQLLNWVYQKGVTDWDLMTNLSKGLRQKLAGSIRLSVLEQVRVQSSQDCETHKFLWRLRDGSLVESVLICSGERRTVCVSSQVGCPAKCAFCASGKQGFMRNLQPAEIVEQVVQINRWLIERGERVCHVVYMGMGEPLKNYDSVIRSIRMLSHPDMLNISQRRITVSTVGIVEGIKRLTNEGLKISLVLSLHAPNQHVRMKIIPYARKYPLEDILQATDEYSEVTKRDITFEYTLLSGINDDPEHAFELAQLLRGKQCTVNLIPYNPVAGLKLQRPDKKQIKAFRTVLFGCRVPNTCRYTKGDDIAAACGQLAMQQKSESEAPPALKVVNDD